MRKETAPASAYYLRVASHGQEESLGGPTGLLPADLNGGRIAMIQALIPLGVLAAGDGGPSVVWARFCGTVGREVPVGEVMFLIRQTNACSREPHMPG